MPKIKGRIPSPAISVSNILFLACFLLSSCQSARLPRFPVQEVFNEEDFLVLCQTRGWTCHEYALWFDPSLDLPSLAFQLQNHFSIFVGAVHQEERTPENNSLTTPANHKIVAILPDQVIPWIQKEWGAKLIRIEKNAFSKALPWDKDSSLKTACPSLWKNYFLIGFSDRNRAIQKKMRQIQAKTGYASDWKIYSLIRKLSSQASISFPLDRLMKESERNFRQQLQSLFKKQKRELYQQVAEWLRGKNVRGKIVTVLPTSFSYCPKVEAVVYLDARSARWLRVQQDGDFYLERMRLPYEVFIGVGFTPVPKRIARFLQEECSYTVYSLRDNRALGCSCSSKEKDFYRCLKKHTEKVR